MMTSTILKNILNVIHKMQLYFILGDKEQKWQTHLINKEVVTRPMTNAYLLKKDGGWNVKNVASWNND